MSLLYLIFNILFQFKPGLKEGGNARNEIVMVIAVAVKVKRGKLNLALVRNHLKVAVKSQNQVDLIKDFGHPTSVMKALIHLHPGQTRMSTQLQLRRIVMMQTFITTSLRY